MKMWEVDSEFKKGIDKAGDWSKDAVKKFTKSWGGAGKGPSDITGGDTLRKMVGLGKDSNSSTASAPKGNTKAPAPTASSKPSTKIDKIDNLPVGSAYSDDKETIWKWSGTGWTDGKTIKATQEGFKEFLKAQSKGKVLVAPK